MSVYDGACHVNQAAGFSFHQQLRISARIIPVNLRHVKKKSRQQFIKFRHCGFGIHWIKFRPESRNNNLLQLTSKSSRAVAYEYQFISIQVRMWYEARLHFHGDFLNAKLFHISHDVVRHRNFRNGFLLKLSCAKKLWSLTKEFGTSGTRNSSGTPEHHWNTPY